jgi:pyruvate dehydrogenase E2 component (dihydrolipoamide acetyltransferase)
MAKTFNLPAVGDTMVEGAIVEWFVAVGDEVDLDQPICSIETDKSVVEMSTPHRGTVLRLGADIGGVVEVGSPLLIVGEAGEEIPDLPPPVPVSPTSPRPSSGPAAAEPTRASFAVSPLLRRFAHEEGVDLALVRGSGPGGRITRADIAAAIGGSSTHQTTNPTTPGNAPSSNGTILAMPKVRKAAREAAIDLATIVGTGPRGSITLADLPTVAPIRGRRERMTAMRRAIARNLTASAQQIPQFTSMIEFEASHLMARRAELRASTDDPIPLDAVLLADLVAVLAEHPLMNAQLLGDEIEFFDAFDVGVAVDTPDGLMVPVVTHAETRNMADLAHEITRLASAARDRSIHPDELTGGTCTLNNVGALGIVAGTPILPMGTSTIVAIGAARPTLRLVDGEAAEVPMSTISATFDHRLIDGGDSARFLHDLKEQLQR